MNAVLSEVKKLDKYLVHKDFDDDLLVCNARGPLPSFLDEGAMSLSCLTPADRLLLATHYSVCDRPECRLNNGAPHAHLRSVPEMIDKSRCATALADPEVLECVRRNYREEDAAFVLEREYVHEIDEVNLLLNFGNKSAQMSDAQRHDVSEVIDKLPGLNARNRPHILYVTMFNDTKNYFFYRKHHEHVPGIMLIEVARQAMYAQFYKFSGHKRDQVSLTIDSFGVEFMNFVDANYPVRIAVETPGGSLEAARSVERDYRITTFYQHNKVVAVAKLGATLIKIALFKRLRKITADRKHRFVPVKSINPTVSITDGAGERIEATINDLSIGGMNIGLTGNQVVEVDQTLNFCFYTEGIGFIHGNAVSRWSEVRNGITVVGMEIVTLLKYDDARLRDVIKNYTHVVTRREVL